MAPASLRFTVLDTRIGPVGLAWRGQRVACVQLPEASEAATVERLLAKVPGAVPGRPTGIIATVARGLKAHLTGRSADLSATPLELDGVSPFHRAVYEAARQIPPGQVLSYGELARRAGRPGAARAVGGAMGKNRFPIVVPCHRVVGADGKPGGFSAHRGVELKREILALEKAPVERAAELAVAPPFDRAGAVAELSRADRRLAKLIAKVGPCGLEIRPHTETFAALAQAIVYQQLNGKAAATIFERVQAAVGPTLDARAVARTSDEALRGAGLSANKLKALRDLAARDLAGEIPARRELEALDDEEIVERLTAVRGVGRWTVEMLLIFRLGRPDVWPVDDYGVRSGFQRAFGHAELPSPKALRTLGDRWKPWRSVAAWYLWRVLDLPEKKSTKRAR